MGARRQLHVGDLRGARVRIALTDAVSTHIPRASERRLHESEVVRQPDT
jgi:hypothetical protein